MSAEAVIALRKIKGIGTILAQRLVDGGILDYRQLVAAGETGLAAVRGVNPRAVPSILEQAAALADTEKAEGREEKVAHLKASATRLREDLQALAASMRERFGEKLAGKKGKKLEKDIFRILSSLEKVVTGERIKIKKTGKGLAKADRRLTGLHAEGLKQISRNLKKTRKTLDKTIP
jgi:NAD(P)-dependent dehydrogenase (short-subunit alcohol dehydrogenase family)